MPSCRARGERGAGGLQPPPPQHFFENYKEVILRKSVFSPPPHFESLVNSPPPPPHTHTHFQSSSAGPVLENATLCSTNSYFMKMYQSNHICVHLPSPPPCFCIFEAWTVQIANHRPKLQFYRGLQMLI